MTKGKIPKDDNSIDESLEKEEQLEKEPNYLEDLQRLQAEFQNFQTRTEKEKSDLIQSANKNLILKLLDTLETLEKAISHEENDEALKLIQRSLLETLEKEGLKEVPTDGKFNPELHEAIKQEESNTENSILEVYTKGYTLNEKLLKPAIVKISKLGEVKNE